MNMQLFQDPSLGKSTCVYKYACYTPHSIIIMVTNSLYVTNREWVVRELFPLDSVSHILVHPIETLLFVQILCDSPRHEAFPQRISGMLNKPCNSVRHQRKHRCCMYAKRYNSDRNIVATVQSAWSSISNNMVKT